MNSQLRFRVLSLGLASVMTIIPSLSASGQEAAKTAPAATPEAAPAPKVEEVAPPPTEKGESGGGLFYDPLRIGATASVGFPFLLNYSIDATWMKTWGAAFQFGKFNRDLNKDTQIELYNWDLRGRWFPWKGSFFLGAAYGNQGIGLLGKSNMVMAQNGVDMTIPTTVKLTLNTTYLTPHLGWFATWDWGFTMGFEVGYQMPLSTMADLKVAFDNVPASYEDTVKNSPEFQKTKADAETAAEGFGKKAVPYVNLLRIGWMF